MSDVKKQLAQWIDDDRDKIVTYLRDFVRAKSPNPPGLFPRGMAQADESD